MMDTKSVEPHAPVPGEPSAFDSMPEIEKSRRSSNAEEQSDDAPSGRGTQLRLEKQTSTASIADRFSLPHEIAFIAVICSAQLTTQAALGQAIALNRVLGDHFGVTDPGILAWFVAGYSLTVGTFILVSGRLGDLFGYKKLMIIGWLWFALWSLICGLSAYSNHVLFIFARVLQGIGPSILIPNALAILGVTYRPGPRKNLAFALFGASAPGGGIIGSTFAGIFNLAWWPWAFFALAITLVALAGLTYLVVPNEAGFSKVTTIEKISVYDKIRHCDPVGGFVGVSSLVLFNFAWNQAPTVGWQSAQTIVTLVLGVLLVPVFFWVELKVTKYPLIPFDALSVDVGLVLVCLAFGWSSFGIWYWYIWQYLLRVRELSILMGTAWLSPVAVSGAIAAIVTGRIFLPKLGPPITMALSMAAFFTGTVLVMTMPVDQIYWAQMFVCTLIVTFGMDMSFPAGTLILSDAVKREHQGIAASLANTVVNYSISLGLGFAGTVEVHQNNGGKTKEDALKGYRSAWYMGAGLSGLGLVVGVLFVLKSVLRRWQVETKPSS